MDRGGGVGNEINAMKALFSSASSWIGIRLWSYQVALEGRWRIPWKFKSKTCLSDLDERID